MTIVTTIVGNDGKVHRIRRWIGRKCLLVDCGSFSSTDVCRANSDRLAHKRIPRPARGGSHAYRCPSRSPTSQVHSSRIGYMARLTPAERPNFSIQVRVDPPVRVLHPGHSNLNNAQPGSKNKNPLASKITPQVANSRTSPNPRRRIEYISRKDNCPSWAIDLTYLAPSR